LFLEGVLGQSTLFYQDRLSGKLSKDITNLTDGVEKITLEVIPSLTRGLSVIITSLWAAYWVNPAFFFVLLTWFALFMTTSILLSKKIVTRSDAQAAAESRITGEMVDALSNHSTIRAFAGQDYEGKRMIPFFAQREQAYRATHMYEVLLSTLQGGLITLMMGFSLYFLAILYGKNLVTMGDFALISGLTMQTSHVIWYTSGYISQWNKALGRCKQSLNALIHPNEITDKPGAQPLVCKKGQIIFNHMDFQYKGNSIPLFRDQSLIIPGGQKVGLVGYSGGGKSTFVNLILRLYDVTAGSISIDGQDIRDIQQNSLRQAIALIPQEPVLFQRSLMENIRYGRITASDGEVIDAAKKAKAHDFIQQLPQGYHSMVGERGVKLSGGQRQRIAIARALLKNAPIFIMDEATSQLDSVTETLIHENLWAVIDRAMVPTPAHDEGDRMESKASGSKNENPQGAKTALVIAHRLSTLVHMDRILVFDQGTVVQDGPHHELVAKEGLYQTLWNTQVDGFLGDMHQPVSSV
jgi:ATP-binding cassette subfamily B protein